MSTIAITVSAEGTPANVVATVAQQLKAHSQSPAAWPVAVALRSAVANEVAKVAAESKVSVRLSASLEIAAVAETEPKSPTPKRKPSPSSIEMP